MQKNPGKEKYLICVGLGYDIRLTDFVGMLLCMFEKLHIGIYIAKYSCA